MTRAIEPYWDGASAVIAYLYGFLAARKLYESDPSLHQGGGSLIAYVLLPFVFMLVMGVVAVIVMVIYRQAKVNSLRLVFSFVAIAIFLFVFGKPTWILLCPAVVIYFTVYFYANRSHKDAQDLNEFMEK